MIVSLDNQLDTLHDNIFLFFKQKKEEQTITKFKVVLIIFFSFFFWVILFLLLTLYITPPGSVYFGSDQDITDRCPRGRRSGIERVKTVLSKNKLDKVGRHKYYNPIFSVCLKAAPLQTMLQLTRHV